MNSDEGTVYVVDDDHSVRRALERLLRAAGLAVESYQSAQAFLDRAPSGVPACLVLDVRMPDMTGPDLQRRLKAAGDEIPIVFLTGHGDVPLTAQVMKVGAVDVLTKPVQDAELLEAVHGALAKARTAMAERAELNLLQARLARLTSREHEVLRLVIAGLLNKQIAGELGTTERTVKVHRGRVMRKMVAGSVAELVRVAQRLGITPYAPKPGTIPGRRA